VLSLHYAGKLWVQILCLFLACLVGFSRTYLSQHFLIDVVAGSLLGTLCGVALIAFWPSKWTIHDKPYGIK
jgi:membrane-associated phospholipid phosphatase